MGRTGHGFLLWALLCLATCGPSLQEGKPGRCPSERYLKETFIEGHVALCSSDRDCKGNKMCCPDNGYKFCKPPAKERPGNCPAVKGESKERCTDFCTSDSECAKGSKCCFDKCGRTCLPSVGEKKGKCDPKLQAFCFVAVRGLCSTDSTCTDDDKCCNVHCRSTCLKPI